METFPFSNINQILTNFPIQVEFHPLPMDKIRRIYLYRPEIQWVFGIFPSIWLAKFSIYPA